MRGLRKPWPPSNVSPDDQAPRRFADAEQEYRAALAGRTDKARFVRAEFDRLNKAELRQVMSREQRSLCVYCERDLSKDETPRIEHWRPLNSNPEHAIHWHNLYPFVLDGRHVRQQEGKSTAQGERRASRPSLAYRIAVRANRRFHQSGRHVRPQRREHRRGDA